MDIASVENYKKLKQWMSCFKFWFLFVVDQSSIGSLQECNYLVTLPLSEHIQLDTVRSCPHLEPPYKIIRSE